MVTKKCLIIVDMLNDFVGTDGQKGALEVPGTTSIVPGIVAKLKEYVLNGELYVYANDSHSFADVEFRTFPKHCVESTWGASVIDELKFGIKDDNIFNKVTFSGFKDTGLDVYLKAQGVTEIYLCGVATEFCIKNTAIDGLKNGYKVYIHTNLIRGLNYADAALHELAMNGIALIS